MNRMLGLLCFSLTSACSRTPAMTGLGAQRATRQLGEAYSSLAPGERSPRVEAPTLLVELRPDPKEGKLEVRLQSRGVAPSEWTLGDGRGLDIAQVRVDDAQGAVPIERSERDDGAVLFKSRRLTHHPVAFRYVLAPSSGARPKPDPCPLVIEPDRAVFCGVRVLALPEQGHEQQPTRVRLVADGTYLREAASSFGLSDDMETRASAFELRNAVFVFGNLTTAELRAPEGRDHAAALGYVSFDPRWVAAETAGFRTAIDRWLGVSRPASDPSAGLIILGAAHPEQPLQILRRARGLMISADVSAGFTSEARVRVAQVLAQRTVGGAFWMGAREGSDETRGLWFSEGVSRAVALFALRDLGAIDDADLAADANAFLSDVALSGSDGRPMDELAERARANEPEVREEAVVALAARGLFIGLDLGAADLQKVLRTVLRATASEGKSHLRTEAFVNAVRNTAGEAKAARVAAIEGRFLPPDGLALAPCFELAERQIAPFDLGFELAEDGTGVRSLVRVRPGSSVARAGAREGDTIVTLDYAPNRPDAAVSMTVVRAGVQHKLRYLPAGSSRSGKAFIRARRAPPACDPR